MNLLSSSIIYTTSYFGITRPPFDSKCYIFLHLTTIHFSVINIFTRMVVGLHGWDRFSMVYRRERCEGRQRSERCEGRVRRVRRVGREGPELRVQRMRRRRMVCPARQARRARVARAHAPRCARSFAFAGPGNTTTL